MATIELAADATWSWFNDPHCICQQTPDGTNWMHLGWVASNGDVGVTSLNVDTEDTFRTVLHATLEVDDHDCVSLCVMGDDTLFGTVSGHGNTTIRSFRTTDPNDPTSWGLEVEIPGPGNVTYPKPVRFTGGRVMILYRDTDFGSDFVYSDDDAQTWSSEVEFIDNAGERPYLNLCYDERVDRIDVIYTDGHPRNVDNSLYHITLASDGQVRTTDGAAVKNVISSGSITPGQGTRIHDVATADGEAWGWDVCRDPADQDKLYAVFARYPGVRDDFTDGNLNGWTFQTGSATLNASNGKLVPTDTAEKRLFRSEQIYDCETTLRLRTGGSVATMIHSVYAKADPVTAFGVIARVRGDTNVLAAGVLGGALATTAFTPQPNTTYWLRVLVVANSVIARIYTTPPPVRGSGSPVAQITHNLVGGDIALYGSGVQGTVGLQLIPGTTGEWYDDFTAYPLDRDVGDPGDRRYCYAVRESGGQWRVNTDLMDQTAGQSIYPAGTDATEPHYSGGVAISRVDPSVVYTSRQTPAVQVWEIERWQTVGQLDPLDQVREDRPIAFYKGDVFGSLVDEYLANHGTLINSPTVGGAGPVEGLSWIGFDGSARVELTTLEHLGNSLLTATFAFWIRKTGTTGAIECAFGMVQTGTSNIIGVYLNSAAEAHSPGSTEFHLRMPNTGQLKGTINTDIYDGQPHRVAFCATSATTLLVVVDGLPRTVTYSVTSGLGGTPVALDTPLTLGAWNNRGSPQRPMTGELAGVAFYDHRLEPGRMAAHYQPPPAFAFDSAVTSDSAVKNIRPTCPRNPETLTVPAPETVWMAGNEGAPDGGYTSFTSYNTAAMAQVEAPEPSEPPRPYAGPELSLALQDEVEGSMMLLRGVE